MSQEEDGAEDRRPTTLFLIRHGQAVVNVQPIMGGPKGDTGLTETGVRQAELLRDRLRASGEIRPDVIIASTLPRARQTAEIIRPALGEDVPFLLDDDVQELRVGPEGDGLHADEYKRRFGWVDFYKDPLRVVDPGGESWATFMLRVATALTRITREHAGKCVVVVCHGGVIDGSFLHFFGMPLQAVPPAGFHTANTSITCWRRAWVRDRMRWDLAKYNDDLHLRNLPGDVPPRPATPVPTEDEKPTP
jgi:probable phosphoglycerate mutase